MNLNKFDKINGVHIVTKYDMNFESSYTEVRKKEGRILSIKEIQELPNVEKNAPHYQEWKLRKFTAENFVQYITGKKDIKVLEIGAGNGWFTHMIYNALLESEVVGLDVNLLELKQAAEAFNQPKLSFVYGDIFKCGPVFENTFDYIVFNASIQYFSDLKNVIAHVKNFLKLEGEIHILDSPFYDKQDVESAKERSYKYYDNIGVGRMRHYYFHHNMEDLENYDILYNPKKSILHKLILKKGSPFPWIRLRAGK